MSAIESTRKKHFKAVYCIDLNGNIIKEFESVIAGAKWWNEERLNNKYKDNYFRLSDDIKLSYVKNIYINNIKWIYK